jgi:predicted CXXCH cytochrome family protein
VTRLSALGALALAASCGFEEHEAVAELPLVPVAQLWSVELTDVRLPTDVFGDGDAVVVLDGYAGRLVTVPFGGGEPSIEAGPAGFGHPVRALDVASGRWYADPGARDRQGALLFVADDGAVRSVVPHRDGAAFSAVAVAEAGDQLLVADREGGFGWLNPETGRRPTGWLTTSTAPRSASSRTSCGGRTAGCSRSTPRPPRVHGFDADGVAQAAFGTWGLWGGRLRDPRSAALVPGGVLVADAGLDAVQLFGADDAFLGVLASDGQRLDLPRPVAVRHVGGDRYVVLAAGSAAGDPARLVGFELPESVLRERAAVPRHPRLRVALTHADPTAGVVGTSGENCLECHDGLVNDGRQVWDASAHAHPLEVPGGWQIPEDLPLTADGQMQCVTCHSPHTGTPREDGGPTGDVFTRRPLADGQLCRACHGETPHTSTDATAVARASGHPVGADLVRGAPEAMSGTDCLSCHAPHGASGDHLLRDAADGTVCLGCHQEQGNAHRNHPTGAITASDVPISARSELAQQARQAGLGCRTCHDLAGGGGGALLRATDGPLCLSCHDNRKGLSAGPHGDIGQHGLACLGCHDPHGGARDDHLLASHAAGDPAGCRGCHGPGGRAAMGAGSVGHPVGRGGVQCTSCHDPHTPDADPPACATCHDDADRGGHGAVTCAECHRPTRRRASRRPPPIRRRVGASPATRAVETLHSSPGGATPPTCSPRRGAAGRRSPASRCSTPKGAPSATTRTGPCPARRATRPIGRASITCANPASSRRARRATATTPASCTCGSTGIGRGNDGTRHPPRLVGVPARVPAGSRDRDDAVSDRRCAARGDLR